MTKNEPNSRPGRVVIAITALTPVPQLWREALQHLQQSQDELLALFFEDNQWLSAASLPFTREISRLGGKDVDFTSQRASEVHKETIDRAQRELKQLAAEADRELAFEVLAESEQYRIRDIVTGTQTILIIPSTLANRPLFAELAESGCRIVLIST